MAEAERELTVGGGPDRHPLLGFRRRHGQPRLDGHAAHAALDARIGHPVGLSGRVQVRRETVAGAVVQPVIAVFRVIRAGECGVDIAIDGVICAAAHRAARLEEIETAKRQRPVPDIHLLEIFDRRDDSPRVFFQRLVELLGHDVIRLIPADRLPHRVDTRPLLRVGPLHRLLEPMRIVVTHDRGVALRAELAVVRRIRRVALDLVDHTVIGHVNQVGA